MYSWGSGRIGFSNFSDIKEPTQLYFNRSNDGSDRDINKDNDQVPPSDKDIEFIDFCAGRSHSLVLDNKNKVWVFGDIGSNELLFSKYPILDKLLVNENIKQVSCWDRNYAINDNGKVIQWGSSDDGDVYLIPRVIEFNYKIKQISCSLNNTIAVSNEGLAFIDIYQNEASNFKIVQYFIDYKIEINKVACGTSHCLFLDSNGLVYSSGKGIQTGQFNGFDELNNQYELQQQQQQQQQQQEEEEEEDQDNFEFDKPKLIKNLNNIIEIKCGYKHSIALNYYSKQIYGWGENLNGQLGMEGYEYVFEPTIIPLSLVEIKSIDAGAYHTGMVTTSGKLIMVGGVLVENGKFRMNLALGNGDGGLSTIQFKVNIEEDETVISDNLIIPKPESNLINIKEKEQYEKDKQQQQQQQQQKDSKDKDDQDEDGAILSKEEIFEFQYHLNEMFHNDYSRPQYNPQFIESFKYNVIDKVSCGLFHTLATLKKNEIQPIKSLEQLCIEFISNNIIASMESDSSFQDIYKIPLHSILKIDSYLTLSRKHNDKSLRLMYYLKSSYNNNNNQIKSLNNSNQNNSNNNNNNNNRSSSSSSNSSSSSSSSNIDNQNDTIQNQWNEYLNYFTDFDSVAIASISDYSIIAKTNNIDISNGLIQNIIVNGLNNKDNYSNNKIKIENYKDIFTIISITDNKILALNKNYCLVIDKTNLLLVIAIFKRELLLTTSSYILKNFDNNILNLKINGY